MAQYVSRVLSKGDTDVSVITEFRKLIGPAYLDKRSQ